jgi:hypothetical protein
MTTRFAIHPEDFKSYGTEKIREHFLLPKIFADDELTLCYTHYDRLIIGGAKPVSKSILLSCPENLKAEFFLQRRELGIINVGNPGIVIVDGQSYELSNREALYIGKESRDVEFKAGKNGGSLFYFNSAPAHAKYPTRKITLSECESTELGAVETANKRIVRKIMINSVVKTCQYKWVLRRSKQEAFGTPCRLMFMIEEWKLISILIFRQISVYVTFSDNHKTRVISGWTIIKLYYRHHGQFTLAQEQAITLLYGEWQEKILTIVTWTRSRLTNYYERIRLFEIQDVYDRPMFSRHQK